MKTVVTTVKLLVSLSLALLLAAFAHGETAVPLEPIKRDDPQQMLDLNLAVVGQPFRRQKSVDPVQNPCL